MVLKVDITARNMELTEKIKDYVTRKVSKLDRFLPGIDEVRIELALSKSARSAVDRQVAQITIRGKGLLLRAEERAADIFVATDASVEKMERQIERFKGRRHRGRGDGTPASEVAEQLVAEPEQAGETPMIVRRKQFTLVPMDEMEAIEQMALLGHENFFVFFNANTNAINILYHRRDGAFGLIDPKIG